MKDDSSNEPRKFPLQISLKKYEDFLKIKTSYFDKKVLKKVAKSKKKGAPFYEIMKPDTTRFYVLGTAHHLPFELLPKLVVEHLQRAPTIYVESETIGLLASFKAAKEGLVGFEKKEKAKIEKHLNPCLDLFHSNLKAKDLDLKDVYSALLIYDCFFGMDSEVVISSLALKKPVWMLDVPMDQYKTNLILEKLGLEDELKEFDQTEPSEDVTQVRDNALKKLFLLENNVPQFLRESIAENIHDVEDKNNRTQEIEEDIEEYAHFDAEDVEELERQEKELNGYQVQERNDRWIKLLENVGPESLVCVGYGHLPDLFLKWKEKKYKITRL